MRVLFFSIFKYLEIASLAVVNLVLAENVGPAQLGVLMPILIFITYSNYSVIGAPQLILKYLPRKSSLRSKENVINSAGKLFLLGLAVTLLGSFVYLDGRYVFAVFFICLLNFLSSLLLSNLRLNEDFRAINFANFSSSITLLFLTFYYAHDVGGYLIALSFSKFLLVFIFVSSDINFAIKILKGIWVKLRCKVFILYFKSAARITVSGLLFTLLMSLDRLVLQAFKLEPFQLGIYQLADTIGTAFYMGVSTVLFYFYPLFLSKVSSNRKFKLAYLKGLIISAFLPVLLFFPLEHALLMLSGVVFEEYVGVWSLTSKIIVLKVLLLIYSSLLTYYVSISKEFFASFVSILLVALLSFMALYCYNVGVVEWSILPIVFSIVLFVVIVLVSVYEYRKA